MAAIQVLPDQRGYPVSMSKSGGGQTPHLDDQFSQSQFTMAPIPGMAPDAARAYQDVTPTPDVTTQNDAYLRLDTCKFDLSTLCAKYLPRLWHKAKD